MELVLDDELGREQAVREFRRVPGRLVHDAVRAPALEVGRTPEQHPGLAAPGDHRELVDRGDDEVGQLLVDLLVDEEDREALPGALRLGEKALGPCAVHDGAGEASLARVSVLVDELDVLDADRLAAPRAARERKRRLLARAREVVQRRVHLLEAVGRGAAADPEADREASVAELLGIAPAKLLERAHEGGGSPELVEGQEAQRVAEEDRHPAPLVGPALAAQSPQDERERDQTEIRLGLSAAGREVDQVGDAPVVVARDGHARQAHEDERELEGPPLRSLAVDIAPVFALAVSLERGDVHRLVGQDKGLAHEGIVFDELDPGGDARADIVGLLDQLVSRLLEGRPVERANPLRIDPSSVASTAFR
jgi:hypothetical protein